mmetsp:Transcript_44323/g.79501  ORF Transcript_44323/g.79501 Transcript_44323/m.79501 type:complete len:272 (+) Transcript_44323:740-1555(+)
MPPTSILVPTVRFRKLGSISHNDLGGVFIFLKISVAPLGMNGRSKWAKAYTASNVARTITCRFSANSSPLSFHGSSRVRYPFTSRQASMATLAPPSREKASILATYIFLTSSKSMTFVSGPGTSGIFPSEYFPLNTMARWTKFPNVLTKSALCISLMLSSEKLSSPPYGASLHKYHRKESISKRSNMSCGSTTFPTDLDIFLPSLSFTNPCAKTVFGRGSPADMRMHGQITVWNHNISFPMMWTSAGQSLAFSSFLPPSGSQTPSASTPVK